MPSVMLSMEKQLALQIAGWGPLRVSGGEELPAKTRLPMVSCKWPVRAKDALEAWQTWGLTTGVVDLGQIVECVTHEAASYRETGFRDSFIKVNDFLLKGEVNVPLQLELRTVGVLSWHWRGEWGFSFNVAAWGLHCYKWWMWRSVMLF